MAAAGGQLEVSAGARHLEEHAGIPVVIVEAADLRQAQAVAVEADEVVQAVCVPGDAELHGLCLRWWSAGAAQCQREPDLVSQRDAVNIDLRIARLGCEDISLDRQQPKSEQLVEAQHPRVGSRSRDEQRRALLLAADRRCALEQHPADPRALAMLPHGDALDLGIVRTGAGDELQMADHGGPVSCREHAPEVVVATHSRGRVIRQREEIGQRRTGSVEPLDPQHHTDTTKAGVTAL